MTHTTKQSLEIKNSKVTQKLQIEYEKAKIASKTRVYHSSTRTDEIIFSNEKNVIEMKINTGDGNDKMISLSLFDAARIKEMLSMHIKLFIK